MEPTPDQPDLPRLLEGLFERTSEGVFLGWADGAILRANPAACRMLGRTEAELIASGRAGLVADVASMQDLLRRRERDGVSEGISVFRRADGSTFPVEVTSALLPGVPGRAAACVIFRDATLGRRGGSLTALHAVVGSLPVGLVSVEYREGAGARPLGANTAYVRITGGAPPLSGEPAPLPVRFFHADRATAIPPEELPGGRAARTGQPVLGMELHVQRAEGDWRVVLASAMPLPAEDPGVRRAVSVLHDVTEERQAVEAARASEATMRAVIEAAADAFFLHDFEGNVREVNAVACARLGYTREELLRLNVTDIETAFDLAKAQEAWAQVRPGQPFTLHGRHRRKDGTTFPAEIRFSRVERPGGPIFMVLVRDMSEQLAREAALQASQRALRVLSAANEALLRARTEPELFQEACRVAVEQGGFRMAWAGVAEKGEGKEIRPLAWAGHEDGYLAHAHLTWADEPHGRGTAGEAMRTGRVAVANDILGDPRMAPWHEGARARGYASNAALPLIYQGERLGLLGAFSGEKDAFSPEVIEVLQRLADDLAFGLVSLRARAAFEQAAAETELASRLIGLQVSRMDFASGLVSMSPAARLARGLPAGGPDFPLQAVRARLSAEARRGLDEQEAAASAATPERPELPLRPPRAFRDAGGAVHWIDSRERVLFDAAGRRQAILSASIDITDRVAEREQLRALTARIQRVREEEKGRIARDLHDDLGQVLTALRLELRGAEALLEALPADARTGPILDHLVSASSLAADTIGAVQRLSWNLRSEALERLGLDAALRQELRHFERRTVVQVAEALRPVDGLPAEVATAAFRIAQEALTNVARHAGARRVEVALAPEGSGLRLTLADDGRGLPPGVPGANDLGLLGMRERAREFGGDVSFTAREGGGTVVSALLPGPSEVKP